MPKMGNYCKAYPVQQLREFPEWQVDTANLRKEKLNVNGKETESTRSLSDDSFFYLQEDLTVTDGISLDENVVFNMVTPQWREFCETKLKFEVPEYARPAARAESD